jgi:hypothetical protein
VPALKILVLSYLDFEIIFFLRIHLLVVKFHIINVSNLLIINNPKDLVSHIETP